MSPAQCRAARAWLGFTQGELCRAEIIAIPNTVPSELGLVSISTLAEFEGEVRRTHASSIRDIQRVFERAGVTFHMDDEGKPLGISVSPTEWCRKLVEQINERRRQRGDEVRLVSLG